MAIPRDLSEIEREVGRLLNGNIEEGLAISKPKEGEAWSKQKRLFGVGEVVLISSLERHHPVSSGQKLQRESRSEIDHREVFNSFRCIGPRPQASIGDPVVIVPHV